MCCARCTKPIVGRSFKIGIFTYGECCTVKCTDCGGSGLAPYVGGDDDDDPCDRCDGTGRDLKPPEKRS